MGRKKYCPSRHHEPMEDNNQQSFQHPLCVLDDKGTTANPRILTMSDDAEEYFTNGIMELSML